MKKIILFASGSGSNVENIANYFSTNSNISIAAVYTNNPSAFVIERCKKLNIHCEVFTREEFSQSEVLLQKIISQKPDLIVLAGFLWKIPASFVSAFPNQIINIHPALLPKFGGKGMYGDNVHKAVIEAKEKESGITIHYVNEHYDEGNIIFQAKIEIISSDNYQDVANKIHKLEYEYFPQIINEILGQKKS